MIIRNLFLGFIVLTSFISCKQSKEKNFEEQAAEILNKIETERRSELELENLSTGVQEVIEHFNYLDPLVKNYTETKVISSTYDFNKLETESPLSVKSIFFNDDSIEINDISVFRNLEHLEIIGLDSLPNGFYNLKKLRALKIGGGLIKTKLDKRILNLPNLEYLEFMFTDIVLPEEIEQLKKLRAIRFPFSNFDQPYSNIFNIPNLEYLAIKFPSADQLEGISNLKKLKTLSTNVISPELGKLKLTGLILSNDNSSEYPIELAELQSLVALSWWGNHKRQRPPFFISKLKNLEYLEIRDCSIFNEIPVEYDELENLRQFDIYCGKQFSCRVDHLKVINNKINIK
jgi:hypothetical protein